MSSAPHLLRRLLLPGAAALALAGCVPPEPPVYYLPPAGYAPALPPPVPPGYAPAPPPYWGADPRERGDGPPPGYPPGPPAYAAPRGGYDIPRYVGPRDDLQRDEPPREENGREGDWRGAPSYPPPSYGAPYGAAPRGEERGYGYGYGTGADDRGEDAREERWRPEERLPAPWPGEQERPPAGEAPGAGSGPRLGPPLWR